MRHYLTLSKNYQINVENTPGFGKNIDDGKSIKPNLDVKIKSLFTQNSGLGWQMKLEFTVG